MLRIVSLFVISLFALGSLAQARTVLPRFAIGTLSASKDAIKGGLNVWSSCKTKDDYEKVLDAVITRTETHEREFYQYFRDRIDKNWPKKKRDEENKRLYRLLETNRRELSKINEKSKFGAPLDVDCKPFPRTKMIIEKNSAFGDHICVRPLTGGACGWTDKRAFKGFYSLGTDSKTWSPNR
ncbi:hypothetical protein [Roseibium suaedae]|uniref:DUF1311 domain-containing protein n=1 Tax=Roseibium suaedae TaxID=735517 RepID=A0A1M7B233_9HYPH|nr:hypothetical protein [Roseibium suaedae]SHL48709.1 hypothetical protein SAMN05444272_0699 [Roseibium suaedae]